MKIIKKFYFNRDNKTAILINRISKNKLFDVEIDSIVRDKNNELYKVIGLSPATKEELDNKIQTFYISGNFRGDEIFIEKKN